MERILRKYMELDEFFKRAKEATLDKVRDKYELGYDTFRKTGDIFRGNQDDVFRRYSEHDVAKHVGDMTAMLDAVNLDSMYERMWEFRSRLDCGDEVDVDRLLGGEEETCWNGLRRALRGRQSIRVFVNFGGSCGRSRDELMIPGAMATAIAQALETFGIGAEIFGVSGAKACAEDGSTVMNIVRLKSVDQYADFGMIGYVCGDSHVFRNSGFINWIQTCLDNGTQPEQCLGYEASMSEQNLGIDPEERDTCVVVPQIYKVDKAREWLGTSFAKIIGKIKK